VYRYTMGKQSGNSGPQVEDFIAMQMRHMRCLCTGTL